MCRTRLTVRKRLETTTPPDAFGLIRISTLQKRSIAGLYTVRWTATSRVRRSIHCASSSATTRARAAAIVRLIGSVTRNTEPWSSSPSFSDVNAVPLGPPYGWSSEVPVARSG